MLRVVFGVDLILSTTCQYFVVNFLLNKL